jgi:hypothetical protein
MDGTLNWGAERAVVPALAARMTTATVRLTIASIAIASRTRTCV